jgi:electron transport complex protein RnfG
LFFAIFTGILGFVNEDTKGPIEVIKAQIAAEARSQVMAEADDITQRIDDTRVAEIATQLGITTDQLNEIYTATSAGTVVGYTFSTTASGFGGGVGVLTGIDAAGTVTDIRIVSHSETPGLGAKSTDPAFTDRYKGKATDASLVVTKTPSTQPTEIDAITGATITSRAVTTAVNYAIDAYKILTQ